MRLNATKKICEILGINAVSYYTLKVWFRKFKVRNFDIKWTTLCPPCCSWSWAVKANYWLRQENFNTNYRIRAWRLSKNNSALKRIHLTRILPEKIHDSSGIITKEIELAALLIGCWRQEQKKSGLFRSAQCWSVDKGGGDN